MSRNYLQYVIPSSPPPRPSTMIFAAKTKAKKGKGGGGTTRDRNDRVARKILEHLDAKELKEAIHAIESANRLVIQRLGALLRDKHGLSRVPLGIQLHPTTKAKMNSQEIKDHAIAVVQAVAKAGWAWGGAATAAAVPAKKAAAAAAADGKGAPAAAAADPEAKSEIPDPEEEDAEPLEDNPEDNNANEDEDVEFARKKDAAPEAPAAAAADAAPGPESLAPNFARSLGDNKYPAPIEDKNSGYALARLSLPTALQGLVDNLVREHRDEKEFKQEWLEPIRDYFRRRGLRVSQIEEDKPVQVAEEKKGNDEEKKEGRDADDEDDKKEEKKELESLKDLTVMYYVSKVRGALLALDIWHGPRYEAQIEELKAFREFDAWRTKPAPLRIREYYRARKRAIASQQSAWERKLSALDLVPEVLARFTADSIFPHLTHRVLTYRKQRLEKRLQETVLTISDPGQFLRNVFEGFWVNSYQGQLLFCALLLASGRRPADIFSQGCFLPLAPTEQDPSPAWDRYECMCYTGLKPGLTVYKRGTIIPLLVPFGIFINGLRRFRKMWGHVRNPATRAYNREAYNRVFNPAVEKKLILYQKEVKRYPLGSREFRAMYARYSVAQFGAGKNQNLWIKTILMHNNVTTSLNYTRIVFPGDNLVRLPPWSLNTPKPLIQNLLQQRLAEAKFEGKSEAKAYRETYRNRKCMGMTLDEALEGVEDEKIRGILERYWQGQPLEEEETQELDEEPPEVPIVVPEEEGDGEAEAEETEDEDTEEDE